MEVKRALFGPFFSKISEKSVSFFKRTKCKEGTSHEVRQKFWDMGEDLVFFIMWGTGLHEVGQGSDEGGSPPSPPYWITLVEV